MNNSRRVIFRPDIFAQRHNYFYAVILNYRHLCLDLSDAKFVEKTMKQQGEQPMETFTNIANCLTLEKPSSFEDCVKWARLQWQKDYYNQVRRR